jgi:hypothetical protein
VSYALCGSEVRSCPGICVQVCHCQAGLARSRRLLASQAVRRHLRRRHLRRLLISQGKEVS